MTTFTERDAAIAVAAGALPSPSVFYNSLLIALRVSGTGVSWRDKSKEFVYRPAPIWLGDEMRDRVAGLPIVMQHPASGVLDSKEFAARAVGAALIGFVRGTELWCVARIISDDAREIFTTIELDTSPAVLFAKDQNKMIELPTGEKILVEEVPVLLDHLAVVPRGVWSKGAAPSGVEITNKPATQPTEKESRNE